MADGLGWDAAVPGPGAVCPCHAAAHPPHLPPHPSPERSGRKRAKGEMNGKSANINSCARAIYPEGHAVPLTEVVCVFDADQVRG